MAPFFDVPLRPRSRAPARWLFSVGAAFSLLAGASAGSAQSTKPTAAKPAPVAADPASTSATYGDWVLHCQRLGDGDKAQRLCEVSQTIQAQNQRDPIAEVAFGRLPNDPALRLTAALPPSVSFPSAVEVASTSPTVQSVQLQWKRCLPGGCFADSVPGDEIVKAWRTSTSAGKLSFKDAGGHDIVLPVSFRGLAQALDALGK